MEYPAFPLSRKLAETSARATLAGLLVLSGGRSTSAQDVCFESRVTALEVNGLASIATADIDGDEDLDLVLARSIVDQVAVSRNQGNGTFAPVELVYQSPDTLDPFTVIAEDFDGDGDTDVMVYRKGNPGGGGITQGGLALLRNDGTGSFTTVPQPIFNSLVDSRTVVSADFNGDARPDLLVTTLTSQQTLRVLLNDGTGAFSETYQTLPLTASPIVAAVGDIDGDGDVDIASAGNGALYTLTNDGGALFTILQTYPSANPIALTDLDGDGDLDLAATEYLPGQTIAARLNSGNGALSAPTIIHSFGTPSAFVSAENIAVGDVDLDGDVDLVLPWSTVQTGLPALLTVLRNLGSVTFQASANLAPAGSDRLGLARIGDLDADADVDLLVYEGNNPGRLRLHRACSTAGEPICLGDGTGAACPCANHSAPGAQAGCLNSFSTAGTLRGVGMARLANDTLVLNGTGMTNAAVLYFQGSSARVGGLGTGFGDGLLCAGGSVIRLGVRENVGGASVFPGPATSSIHLLGDVVSPGQRVYQAWYRNLASFCAPDGFNVTNGLRVLWAP